MAKVEIVITEGHNYCESHSGRTYTSVRFHGRGYGRSAPCDNEKEIQEQIEYCKKWIREEGDIPVVVDKRNETLLTQWF